MDYIEHEEWLPIPGYEGFYIVSNLGRVMSLDRNVPLRASSKNIRGQLLKPMIKKHGYYRVMLSKGDKRTDQTIHQLVLKAFVGPCPVGYQCRHLNGIPNDNRLVNLKWGTPKENAMDKERHGHVLRGEDHGFSRFTNQEVIYIRSFNGIQSATAVAKMFNTSHSVVLNIWKRKSWKHI